MCLFVFSRCVLAQQVISAGGFMALFARSFCDFAMIKLSRDCLHLNARLAFPTPSVKRTHPGL